MAFARREAAVRETADPLPAHIVACKKPKAPQWRREAQPVIQAGTILLPNAARERGSSEVDGMACTQEELDLKSRCLQVFWAYSSFESGRCAISP